MVPYKDVNGEKINITILDHILKVKNIMRLLIKSRSERLQSILELKNNSLNDVPRHRRQRLESGTSRVIPSNEGK